MKISFKYISFRWFLLPILTVVLCIPYSCEDILVKKLKEGEIVYTVSYPREENNMMVSLMPNEMVMRFKDDQVASEFSASMGLFTMSLIPDLKNKTLTQLIKVISDKKGYVYKENEVQELIDKEPGMKIVLTKETKTIAGYKCRKATVTFDKDVKPSFDLYYTKDIAIKNPNWYTIFKDIDGVILEYEISRYNIDMRLVAKSVVEKKVDPKVFEKPADYKMVTQAQIDEIFENF